MPFFETVDALGIVEQHIQRLLKVEESDAKKLLRRYKEARIELQDRLLRLPEGSFSAQQLRGVLVQVEAGINAMSSGLFQDMREVAPDVAELGVDDLLSEINKFSKHFTGAVVPINVNAVAVAQDTSNFLLNKYQASLTAYGSGIISSITDQLTQSMIMGEGLNRSVGSLVSNIGRFFIGEEWKLLRIARTELHNVYNVGKIRGMGILKDETLPDLMKTLVHPMDARTGDDSKALAVENLVVPIDKPFVFNWRGNKRVFMAPPDRPNDRAILVPYRKIWDE